MWRKWAGSNRHGASLAGGVPLAVWNCSRLLALKGYKIKAMRFDFWRNAHFVRMANAMCGIRIGVKSLLSVA